MEVSILGTMLSVTLERWHVYEDWDFVFKGIAALAIRAPAEILKPWRRVHLRSVRSSWQLVL